MSHLMNNCCKKAFLGGGDFRVCTRVPGPRGDSGPTGGLHS